MAIINNPQCWYIIQQEDRTCKIVAVTNQPSDAKSSWGPFDSQAEAIRQSLAAKLIAKRVGLIRSGKCQPV